MATTTDTKRQSTGNKVATPRVAPSASQAPTEFDKSVLAKAIGARIKLTTTSPATTIEGTVFTTDYVTNIVAIASSPPTSSNTTSTTTTTPKAQNYHIIPIPHIASFTIISLAPSSSSDFNAATPAIGKIDTKAMQAREDAAVQKMKEADARRGKGVGKDAQDIFDAVSRTLPARWANTDIVINDTILLKPPYTAASCVAPASTPASSLERVRRVVDNERRKLGVRAGVNASAKDKQDGNGKGSVGSVGSVGSDAGEGGSNGAKAGGSGNGGSGSGPGVAPRKGG